MKKHPQTNARVSVICPFHNSERFLSEAIDSVLAQDFGDFDLLLVDDGSTDASREIAAAYAKQHPRRIRLLDHPERRNLGAAASRNLALEHSSSELVAFIDSDDVWREGKLGEQVRLLDENREIGMVCGAVNYWRSWDGGKDELLASGKPVGGIGHPPKMAVEIFPLGDAVAPCPSDLLLRRSLIEEIGGFEPQFTGPGNYEDQAFLVKIYLTAPVYFATDVWLDYRIHEESGMATGTREGRHEEMRRIFLRWFADYLARREFPGKTEVVSALGRANWNMEHPGAANFLRRTRKLLTRLGWA